MDLMGDVVAAGATQNRLTGTDFTVVRFDGASGRELWRNVIMVPPMALMQPLQLQRMLQEM